MNLGEIEFVNAPLPSYIHKLTKPLPEYEGNTAEV
jgi:hypothetical protein